MTRRGALQRLLPDGGWTLLFLAPYLIGLGVFIAYPVAHSFVGSLSKWSLFGSPTFAGLDNYARLLGDRRFWQAFGNTVYYVLLLVPGEIAVAIPLAMLVNRQMAGRALFRSIYFMPFVLSLAAISLVWVWLYNPEFGLVNRAIRLLGIPSQNWLGDPRLAMPALVITSIWRNAGYYMVIFLAGLQSIPREMYEAAEIDGAGAWSKFWRVTWPLLTPTTFFAVIIGVILGFQVFDLSYLMTQGGPSGATVTLVLLTYQTAFRRGQLGYASAIAFVLMLVLIIFTLIYFRLQRRWVHYQGE